MPKIHEYPCEHAEQMYLHKKMHVQYPCIILVSIPACLCTVVQGYRTKNYYRLMANNSPPIRTTSDSA